MWSFIKKRTGRVTRSEFEELKDKVNNAAELGDLYRRMNAVMKEKIEALEEQSIMEVSYPWFLGLNMTYNFERTANVKDIVIQILKHLNLSAVHVPKKDATVKLEPLSTVKINKKPGIKTKKK